MHTAAPCCVLRSTHLPALGGDIEKVDLRAARPLVDRVADTCSQDRWLLFACGPRARLSADKHTRGQGRASTFGGVRIVARDLLDRALDRRTLPAFGSSCRIRSQLPMRTARA